MRYKTGEMVFLKGELEGVGAVRIGALDSSGMYELPEYDMWVGEDSIDHGATERLNRKPSPWFDYEVYGPEHDDDSLSLTIHIHGAKAYRDKLEELHRHIETVERTIEQLNEMDMTIEMEEG